ncbi:SRPBCC family protein [Bremerella sp. JC770]|uniref:SRPBCC family protein n=1 Tax=Bremerella sp. JC770 TaxID=3232137 RepID=UPI003459E07C
MTTEITPPNVNVQMLMRVPVQQAFQAFVDPDVTTRFWFSHSSGPLAVGQEVLWEWRMFGVSTQVHVEELVENRRIVMQWGDEGKRATVDWKFEPRGDAMCLVDVTNFGFVGSPNEMVDEAIDSMGGFSLVLAGAKAFLEHGIELNLIRDRFPDNVIDS